MKVQVASTAPDEALTVWGLDPQLRHVGFAVMTPDGWGTDEFFCSKFENQAEALAELRTRAELFFDVAAVRHGIPAAVAVELPIHGHHVTPSLVMACGVVQLAAHAVLAEAGEFPVPVWTVTAGEWKKLSVGHGNATKDKVREWADERGLSPEASQDEADALGIATAAYRMLGLPE